MPFSLHHSSRFGVCLIFLLGFFTSAVAQPYLSDLQAGADDPLFATYAAPLARSQFIVDEGYHFRYYVPDRGADFTTDSAGSLGIAFKKDGDVRYGIESMHAPPVVTASYSDLVRYQLEPFKDVQVDVHFQVYSSRLALQDIRVTNAGSESITIDLFPFLEHEVENVRLSEDERAFAFRHVEHPDGWTTSHGVPHVTDLENVYLLSDTPDAFGAYTALDAASPSMGGTNQNYAVEWGSVIHADGSMCGHRAPQEARQMVIHSRSWEEVLTEGASKWGDTEPNIPGDGFQGAELGNFSSPEIAVGDSFTVVFTCLATNQQGVGRGVVSELPDPDGIRTDIQLEHVPFPDPPDDLSVEFGTKNRSAILSWSHASGVSYDLYRRIGSPPGVFTRIAEDLTKGEYVDSDLDPGAEPRYIVVPQTVKRRGPHSLEVGRFSTSPLFTDIKSETLDRDIPSTGVHAIAFQKSLALSPGETDGFRVVRGVADARKSEALRSEAEDVLTYNVDRGLEAAENIYSRIPKLAFEDPEHEATYWNAFSLMRQVMLPPEGESSHNYYVFSREPTWGWGHGGQVFHESLTMLAYVFMDPESAMNSQRVYMERQHDDGYINYRTGSYLNEVILTKGERTTSAPWYNWTNWEIYRQTQDRAFLADAYESGSDFYEWWLRNRDQDNDGLLEWGAHAVLESVRDGKVAVWDHVAWPANFEAVDLNSMLVKEARSLAEMARVLGDTAAAAHWTAEADIRSRAINETFWDEETGFYYHVDRDDHDFAFKQANDLKRQEIVGFLPLWAGVSDSEQTARLVGHLTDPTKFWRPHGIPSLAADDPYYDPMGYWNGPVWVEWQYLIFRGLLDAGYADEAAQLADRVIDHVAHHLKESHTFWELYSPDKLEAGHHQTYIWTGLVARMMLDLRDVDLGSNDESAEGRASFGALVGFPNPFEREAVIGYHLRKHSHVRVTR